jgi:hypothetical protein
MTHNPLWIKTLQIRENQLEGEHYKVDNKAYNTYCHPLLWMLHIAHNALWIKPLQIRENELEGDHYKIDNKAHNTYCLQQN